MSHHQSQWQKDWSHHSKTKTSISQMVYFYSRLLFTITLTTNVNYYIWELTYHPADHWAPLVEKHQPPPPLLNVSAGKKHAPDPAKQQRVHKISVTSDDGTYSDGTARIPEQVMWLKDVQSRLLSFYAICLKNWLARDLRSFPHLDNTLQLPLTSFKVLYSSSLFQLLA